MSDDHQFNLLGFDAPPPTPSRTPRAPKKKAAFSLFLAAMPEDEEKPRFDRLAEGLRSQHGLKPAMPHDRRHLSLLSIEEYAAPLKQVELDARCSLVAAALSRMKLPSLSVNFNSAMTLGRPGETREMPYVLRCDEESTAAVLDLCRRLGPPLIGKAPRSFAPHMTLLYDASWVGQHAIEPLNWTPRNLTLILSHVGKSRYEHLGQWQLGA